MEQNGCYKLLIFKRVYRLIFLFSLFLAMTPSAQAANITLAWDKSNPAPETYRLFQRTSGRSYNYSDNAYEGTNTQCTLSNLSPNTTYYFVVRACSGQSESSDSNEVTYTTPAATNTGTDQNSSTDTNQSSNTTDTNQSNDTSSNVVIDNGDSGSTSTGSWSASKGPNPFGGSSLYTREAKATYTFKSSQTGLLDVSLWWTQWASRPTAAPIKIYDGNLLLDTVYVNQRINGGQWNQLGQGIYSFSNSARITIVSDGTSSSTCADAVKFAVHSDTPDPDVNPNTNTNTNPSSGTGSDIVIDNGDSGSSSTGSWSASKGPNPFGGSSLYTREAKATYTFKSSQTGILDVSLWWTQWASRPTAAPIKIYDGNLLLDTIYINQRVNGGKWNQLGQGRYSFSDSARITIVSDGTSSSTCADAVKFAVHSDTPDPGINPNTNTNTNPSSGTGSDIIIDNGDSGSKSTGSWEISGAPNSFGNNSLYSRQANAFYSYASPATGKDLEISVWYTQWSSRCTAVPVDIYDGNNYLGSHIVNQRKGSGQWKVLGTYDFSKSVKVEIVSEGNNCSTNADAVRIR